MTLCISADNERITGGVFAKDGKLFASFRVGCDRNKTSDEYSALFRTVLRLKGVEISDIKGAALSSVVPSLTSVLKSALFELTASQPVAVGAGIKTGVSIRTDNPSELGGDLVCLAAAALSKKAFPAVIVSVGAAVTFVAVDGSKNLIGCAIAPGISTSLSALSKSAELLTTVDLNKNPPSAIGKNTENSLLSGFVSGFACMIDGMTEKIAAEIGGDCRFLMSGCPQSVINCCKTQFEIDDDMILEGLYTIYLKNRM